MVTKEDLKVGVIFSASNQTNFDSKYKIVEHIGNECIFINIDNNSTFRDYTFNKILDFINSGKWRLEKPKENIYELW
jgi:hypothetical protein